MKNKWICNWCGDVNVLEDEDLKLQQIADRMASAYYAKCDSKMCKDKRLRRMNPADAGSKKIYGTRYKDIPRY